MEIQNRILLREICRVRGRGSNSVSRIDNFERYLDSQLPPLFYDVKPLLMAMLDWDPGFRPTASEARQWIRREPVQVRTGSFLARLAPRVTLDPESEGMSGSDFSSLTEIDFPERHQGGEANINFRDDIKPDPISDYVP
jgi:hypothetical protein